MTAVPLLLLDVDGVLSPYTSTSSQGGSTEWGDWTLPDNIKMHLPLSHTMGDALRATGCEIEWLTTWGDDANRIVAAHLGWPTYPVWRKQQVPGGSRLKDDELLGWWKWRWAKARAEEGRPLIWCDDEIGARRVEDPRIDEWIETLDQPLLLVSCDPHVGMTEMEVSEIADFVHLVKDLGY